MNIVKATFSRFLQIHAMTPISLIIKTLKPKSPPRLEEADCGSPTSRLGFLSVAGSALPPWE